MIEIKKPSILFSWSGYHERTCINGSHVVGFILRGTYLKAGMGGLMWF